MLQALCWPVARLAGLACMVVSGSKNVLLLYEGACPSWLHSWLIRLLRWTRHLTVGEVPVTFLALSSSARVRLGSVGDLRAEFSSGAFGRVRGLIMREAADFSHLKALAVRGAGD